MKTLYQLLLDRWNQKTDTVLVTIVEGNGSIPRTTGAYMAVDKTGRIYGTIGGGNLEYQAVKKAMELTGTDAHFVEDFDLETGENGGLGMVCGGNVKVLFYSVRMKDPAVGAFFKEALVTADEGKPYWLVLPFSEGLPQIRKEITEGRGQYANPSSITRAAAMMLRHIGYADQAAALDKALDEALDGLNMTSNSQGNSTDDFTKFVIEHLK